MLNIYLIKVLKKIGLLERINFILKKEYNGIQILIPFINGIGLTNLIIKREWLDSLIDLFVKGENKAFVDVGVNIGQTLIRIKTACPDVRYIGFEPNSTCTAYAQKLAKLNNFSNFTVQNTALSSKVDNLILEKTLVDDSRASLISELRPNYFLDKENVIAMDYQSFYLEEDICFVKIDVEGGEYEVIKGMTKAIEKHQPIITCEVLDSLNSEVHDFTQKRATLVCEMLKSLDYEIIQLQTNKKNDKLVSFKMITEIVIKQWTNESSDFNDYLFYPNDKKENVIKKIRSLCN